MAYGLRVEEEDHHGNHQVREDANLKDNGIKEMKYDSDNESCFSGLLPKQEINDKSIEKNASINNDLLKPFFLKKTSNKRVVSFRKEIDGNEISIEPTGIDFMKGCKSENNPHLGDKNMNKTFRAGGRNHRVPTFGIIRKVCIGRNEKHENAK